MHVSLQATPSEIPAPAIFLDRDGTINIEKNYLYKIADWQWIPGAEAAIAALNRAGFLVVVVSNQAGIARGYYAAEDVDRLHAYVSDDLATKGGCIDAYYYCEHHPDFSLPCACRKPAPGMLFEGAAALNIDLARSWMVGDKRIDLAAGEAAGTRTVLVRTGYGREEEARVDTGQLVADDLPQAAALILASRYDPLPRNLQKSIKR